MSWLLKFDAFAVISRMKMYVCMYVCLCVCVYMHRMSARSVVSSWCSAPTTILYLVFAVCCCTSVMPAAEKAGFNMRTAEKIKSTIKEALRMKRIRDETPTVKTPTQNFDTLGTRGNSLAKSGRPKAGKTSVRSEASEGPNASSLWWRTPMVSLCLIQILYLITDWLFKNVFLVATTVGQKRSREMNRFFQ